MARFTGDNANDIANDIAARLVNTVATNGGSVPEIMTTLTMVQALVVKNCLNLIKDGMNMTRADAMLVMSSERAKQVIRSLTVRSTN